MRNEEFLPAPCGQGNPGTWSDFRDKKWRLRGGTDCGGPLARKRSTSQCFIPSPGDSSVLLEGPGHLRAEPQTASAMPCLVHGLSWALVSG
jgi:hypothetical protein